jgi:uncharacterized protein involved in exopolysaccharide biosynthesis
MFWRSRSEIGEEVENGAPVSIEAVRPRRRMKVILTLALSAALGGFLISYLFPAHYASTSTVLVEGPKVPDEYVHPIITSDFTQRIQILSQVVVSPVHLRPMVKSLALVEPEDELISDIQQNMTIEPVITSFSEAVKASPIGFTVTYVDSDPVRAQKICNALTDLIVNENLHYRSEIAKSTIEFLARQLEDAKRVLDDQDAKVAAFKKKYLVYQGRAAMSPDVEEQYKLLTRDTDNAQAFYKDLLAKKSSAELGASMENQQMGEQMNIVATAGLPDSPDFPDRLLFALGGMGAGLMLGIGRALWPVRKIKMEPQSAVTQQWKPSQ